MNPSKMKAWKPLLVVSLFILNGCNVGSVPHRISGTYVSDLEYLEHQCHVLDEELLVLEERRDYLYERVEMRYSSNQAKAILFGVGDGDGPETVEYSQVLGRIDAINRVKKKKGCPGSSDS